MWEFACTCRVHAASSAVNSAWLLHLLPARMHRPRPVHAHRLWRACSTLPQPCRECVCVPHISACLTSHASHPYFAGVGAVKRSQSTPLWQADIGDSFAALSAHACITFHCLGGEVQPGQLWQAFKRLPGTAVPQLPGVYGSLPQPLGTPVLRFRTSCSHIWRQFTASELWPGAHESGGLGFAPQLQRAARFCFPSLACSARFPKSVAHTSPGESVAARSVQGRAAHHTATVTSRELLADGILPSSPGDSPAIPAM